MIKLVIKSLYFVLCFSLFQSVSAAEPLRSQNSEEHMQAEILGYINQYRHAHGLKILKMNRRASVEARQHSLDMATHRVSFGHKGFEKRVKRLFKDVDQCSGGAENVAYNYKTAKIVVDEWIKSPGHRRNLMGNYSLTGIGTVRDEQGRIYFTQIFLCRG